MEKLINLISNYVGNILVSDKYENIYSWEIKQKYLPEGIQIIGNNLLEQNLNLKRSLHLSWLNAENNQRKGDLIEYYIKYWGGIRTNNFDTMNFYRCATINDLLNKGITGIASWSKALVIHNPDQYAIYDVRVVASLNYIQLLNQNENSRIKFRIINGGRNVKINSANRIIKEKKLFSGWEHIQDSQLYIHYYLPILRNVAEKLGCNLSMIEMILFGSAPQLADQIIMRY